MQNKYLFIIFGPCGAGKTTIGKKISINYNIPILNRDSIKEILYDSLGWSDRAWCEKLGKASYELMYYFTEKLLSTESSFIIESNFNFTALKEKMIYFKEKYKFKMVFIRCYAQKNTLFDRVIKRDESGERHPGHIYPTNYNEYQSMLLGNNIDSIHINCDIKDNNWDIIELDTTNFNDDTYNKLFYSIDTILKK